MTILISLLLLLSPMDKPAYQIFDKAGKEVLYSDVFKASSNSQVVLFGEIHNSPVSHWLQYELIADLNNIKNTQVIVGAEMLESDDQIVIDEYLSGLIEYRHFEKEVKLWPNFQTDYKPALEFAKENSIPFIATNVPRRYASLVAYKGFDTLSSLSEEAKSFLPPLPISFNPELPGYKILKEMGGNGHGKMKYMAEAQALKDATMAHFIYKNTMPAGIFLHINGSYHSNNYEGIYWYLRQKQKDLEILTIATVEQESLEKLDKSNYGLADYIIVVPKTFTKSH